MDGSRTKPALFLSTSYELFMGNASAEEVTYSGCELCGFNTGVYEQKIVTGKFVLKLSSLQFRIFHIGSQ